jgi:hypothetical protein
MDIAVQTTEELIDITERVKPIVEKEPPNSVICLCNVKGSRFNTEITQILKEFTKHNEPYMKMTALLGVEGLKKVIYDTIVLYTRRQNLILKNSIEALDWLVEQ